MAESTSPASWKPLAFAAGVFVLLLGGAVIPTLLGDDDKAEVFSTPTLSGIGEVQVGLGCQVRGRILETRFDYQAPDEATSYQYSFGDGSQPREFTVDNGQPNRQAVYTYNRPGRYVVTLRLTTPNATGEDSCTVSVR